MRGREKKKKKRRAFFLYIYKYYLKWNMNRLFLSHKAVTVDEETILWRLLWGSPKIRSLVRIPYCTEGDLPFSRSHFKTKKDFPTGKYSPKNLKRSPGMIN